MYKPSHKYWFLKQLLRAIWVHTEHPEMTYTETEMGRDVLSWKSSVP